RMSCSRPNLQQVPREKAYRRCFVAAPGHILIKCDFSQIELRITAKVTGDRRMLAAYRQGEDLHTLTAARFLGVTPDRIANDSRGRREGEPGHSGGVLGARRRRGGAKGKGGGGVRLSGGRPRLKRSAWSRRPWPTPPPASPPPMTAQVAIARMSVSRCNLFLV